MAAIGGYSGYFNVKDYKAVGDGVTNDSPAIQKAITAARVNDGGIVWFPSGSYLIDVGERPDRGISISAPVILAGVGAGTSMKGTGHHTTDGSKLIVNNVDITPIFINGRGTTVRDLAIYHQQPDPGEGWKPHPYKAAIFVFSDDVYLENIYLHNPTIGIELSSVGRVSMHRVFGQPLKIGILVDLATDSVKINNIHFERYWSTDTSVTKYIFENAIAVQSLRNDNPHFSNISATGYHIGFHFGSSSAGATSKFCIVNADNGGCCYGIVIDGRRTTGQIANYTYQGFARKSEVGIAIKQEGVVIQATNIRISYVRTNGIRVSGGGSWLGADNVWIEGWNYSKVGFPAIEAATKDATVSVGINRYFTLGDGGRELGGVGHVVAAASTSDVGQ
jgi:hypothetical protein